MPLGKPARLFRVCHVGGSLGRWGQVAGRLGGVVIVALVFPINGCESHGYKEAKDFLHLPIQAD